MALQEDGGSTGWPLGLQPVSVRVRLMEHLRLAETGAFLGSTPSISSESSSDLDTESTGSFFPEKSTTLGSLIGIQSIALPNESRGEVPVTETPRRRGSVRHRSWCGFMGCGSSDASQDTISPSLAHLLELERRSTVTQRGEVVTQLLTGEGYSREQAFRRNTLFANDRILPPQPSGAPLRVYLAQASPSSSYLSGDWSASVTVFEERSEETLAHRRSGSQNGRDPRFGMPFSSE